MAKLTKAVRSYRRMLDKLGTKDIGTPVWRECHRFRLALEDELGRDAVRNEIIRQRRAA